MVVVLLCKYFLEGKAASAFAVVDLSADDISESGEQVDHFSVVIVGVYLDAVDVHGPTEFFRLAEELLAVSESAGIYCHGQPVDNHISLLGLPSADDMGIFRFTVDDTGTIRYDVSMIVEHPGILLPDVILYRLSRWIGGCPLMAAVGNHFVAHQIDHLIALICFVFCYFAKLHGSDFFCCICKVNVFF